MSNEKNKKISVGRTDLGIPSLWMVHIFSYFEGIGKLWATLKSHSKSGRRNDQAAVIFGVTTVTDPMKSACYFNRKFL